jgi:hypothetical protein
MHRGRPASPLPVTPAGEAAEEGERGAGGHKATLKVGRRENKSERGCWRRPNPWITEELYTGRLLTASRWLLLARSS